MISGWKALQTGAASFLFHRSRARLVRVALACAALVALPAAGTAQLWSGVPAFGVGASLGDGGVGVEVEYRPLRPLAFLAREAGWPIADGPGWSGGARLDAVGNRYARVYLLPFAGQVLCPEAHIGGASACGVDAGWRWVAGALLGGELALTGSGRPSLAIEDGYRTDGRPSRHRIRGPVFGAVFRWRITR